MRLEVELHGERVSAESYSVIDRRAMAGRQGAMAGRQRVKKSFIVVAVVRPGSDVPLLCARGPAQCAAAD